MLFAQRLQTGPVPLRHSGSVLDLVIAQADVFILQEVTRQSGASISAAFDGCGWIPGRGRVKQKSDSGRGQACSKFQHPGDLPNLFSYTFWAFQNQRSLRYRNQGVIMLSRGAIVGRARITL